MTTVANLIAEFCCRSWMIPEPVQERALACLADHLHASMHGARSSTGTLLRQYRAGVASGESLALYLGATSAVFEIDDVHRDTTIHTGTVIFPAILGASDAVGGVPGSRLISAIVLGYEVAVQLCIVAGESHYRYFHSTATCGTVAAAVAASLILRLDPQQMSNAIGIAATSASGLWEGINNEAVAVKHFHSGFAAERGLRSARLAQLGLEAASQGIEGERGFLNALSPDPGTGGRLEEMRRVFSTASPENWMIMRGIFKRYPFCLGCFEPLEGVRHLIHNRDTSQVSNVRIELYPRSAMNVAQTEPKTDLEAKFSAPFAAALALAGYDPESVFIPIERLSDPTVTAWYPKIQCGANPNVPRRHAPVTMEWVDGSVTAADLPLRSLEETEVWDRFDKASRQYLGPDAESLRQDVWGCRYAPNVNRLIDRIRLATLACEHHDGGTSEYDLSRSAGASQGPEHGSGAHSRAWG